MIIGVRRWARTMVPVAVVFLVACGPARGDLEPRAAKDAPVQTAPPTTAAGGADRTPGEARLAKSAAQTAAVSTGRILVEYVGTGKAVVPTATIESAFDADQALVQVDTTFSFGGGGDRTITVIYDRGTGYARVPAFGSDNGSPRWVSWDMGDASAFEDAVGEIGRQDPGAVLQLLEQGGRDVTSLGREAVRGVETDHYSANLVVAEAVELASPAVRDRLQQAADVLGISLDEIDPIPVEVWIDDEGLVRKVVVERESSTATLELYDLGEPVTIELPDPADVSDLSPGN